MSFLVPTYLVDQHGVPIDGTNPLEVEAKFSGTVGAVDQGNAGSAPESWYIQDGSGSLATGAKQDTGNTSLSSILGQLDAKTSTLATATKQDTGNTSLAAIATSLTDGNQKTQITSSALPTGAAKDSTLTDGSALLRLTSDKSNVAAVQNTAPTTEYGIVTRNIPSGTQTVAGTVTVTSTSANQGTGAGAAAPWSFELSDGAAFYTGAKTGQFPTALGQTTKAGSLSVTLPSDIAGTTPTTSTKTASSAVALFASNTSAKKRVISNLPSSNGILYVLYGSGTPTNDGANCSFAVQPGQSWEEQVIDGALCYNGAIQGILATGSTVQVCEIQ
jgi:hypothetical protein